MRVCLGRESRCVCVCAISEWLCMYMYMNVLSYELVCYTYVVLIMYTLAPCVNISVQTLTV